MCNLVLAPQEALLGGHTPVEFEPTHGFVPAHGKIQLLATFRPLEETTYNYCLLCTIKNKPTTLSLTVKGEGYAIHDSVQMQGAEGQLVTLSPKNPTHLDIGQIIIHERLVKNITMLNTGNVSYNFVWDAGPNNRVTVSPAGGSVAAGSRQTVELSYNPARPERLDRYPVTCQIINGPKYTLLMNGEGHKPRLDLSFYSFDFGPVYVNPDRSADPTRVLLTVRNNDSREVTLNNLFDGSNGAFGVLASSVLLHPGQHAEVPITFTPSEYCMHEAVVPFEVNGLYTVSGNNRPGHFNAASVN